MQAAPHVRVREGCAGISRAVRAIAPVRDAVFVVASGMMPWRLRSNCSCTSGGPSRAHGAPAVSAGTARPRSPTPPARFSRSTAPSEAACAASSRAVEAPPPRGRQGASNATSFTPHGRCGEWLVMKRSPHRSRKMPVSTARYDIRMRGRLRSALYSTFEPLTVHIEPTETVVCRRVEGQAALHGYLQRVESLGLELVDVRRVIDGPFENESDHRRCSPHHGSQNLEQLPTDCMKRRLLASHVSNTLDDFRTPGHRRGFRIGSQHRV